MIGSSVYSSQDQTDSTGIHNAYQNVNIFYMYKYHMIIP